MESKNFLLTEKDLILKEKLKEKIEKKTFQKNNLIVTFFIPQELKEFLEIDAKNEFMSVSNYLRYLILKEHKEKWLKK